MARSPRTTASRTQWMSQKSRSKPASVKVLKAWESWSCVGSILGDGAGGSREDQFGTHQQAHLYNYLYIYIYMYYFYIIHIKVTLYMYVFSHLFSNFRAVARWSRSPSWPGGDRNLGCLRSPLRRCYWQSLCPHDS